MLTTPTVEQAIVYIGGTVPDYIRRQVGHCMRVNIAVHAHVNVYNCKWWRDPPGICIGESDTPR